MVIPALAVLLMSGFAGDSTHGHAPVKPTAPLSRHAKAGDANFSKSWLELQASPDPEIKKLAEYDQVLGDQPVEGTLLFTGLPASLADADTMAGDLASKLHEFERYNLTSTVILEPTIDGKPIDFKLYRQGSYDDVLGKFFLQLKAYGISDASAGTWVYFPEANIPEFGPPDPVDYAANVIRSVRLQKQVFPRSRASILLDSETYPAGSSNWSDGAYVSLMPYLRDLPMGLLDSFGLQGFPWAPPATDTVSESVTAAERFLPASDAIAAARQLGVDHVWLNTGTFARMYADKPSNTVLMTPAQRSTVLDGIVQQAQLLHQDRLTVAINLFSQDKSSLDEATDWSYWHAGQEYVSPSTAIFTSFARKLRANNILLWVFDSAAKT